MKHLFLWKWVGFMPPTHFLFFLLSMFLYLHCISFVTYRIVSIFVVDIPMRTDFIRRFCPHLLALRPQIRRPRSRFRIRLDLLVEIVARTVAPPPVSSRLCEPC